MRFAGLAPAPARPEDVGAQAIDLGAALVLEQFQRQVGARQVGQRLASSRSRARLTSPGNSVSRVVCSACSASAGLPFISPIMASRAATVERAAPVRRLSI